MKPYFSAWACLTLTIVCVLRACQLYWSSTSELRPDSTYPWSPSLSQVPRTSRSQDDDETVISDNPNGLFYFIQISDLHLSKFRATGHTLHFLHFLQTVLPVVKPSFVVVTGDLTDAKDRKRITSQQYLEEWQVYRYAIEQANLTAPWYDMRGNHDCFDLPSWQSRVNLYRNYGISADRVEQGHGIYSWNLDKGYGNYQFVAVDACPKRGPSRPLNFFGYLTSRTMDRLSNAILPVNANHTFVFSHYPTTTMVFGVSSQGYNFRDIARHYSVYLCGHLHRLAAGLGDVLQSFDPSTQTLELELGDMKEHGTFRIMAVDHDLISFIDTDLPLSQLLPSPGKPIVPLNANKQIAWPDKVNIDPVILITNPKDARFAIQTKEPLQRIRQSTHIRFLVFTDVSPDQIQVQVSIDGEPISGARFVGSPDQPLWAVAWDPSRYDNRRIHTLVVQATTNDQRSGRSQIVFRVDVGRAQIKGGPGEWIMSTHMSRVLEYLTLIVCVCLLAALLIPKCYQAHHAQRLATTTSLPPQLSRGMRILLKIHALDQTPAATRLGRLTRAVQRHILLWALRFLQLPEEQTMVWYTSFVFILSLLSLPWFRAEFIPSGVKATERFGTFYMWGLVFGSEWVPIADTWMFAAGQVCFDVAVFVVLFAWRTTTSRQLHCRGSHRERPRPRQLNEHAWFKGGEVVYWLWRASELVALASFYGGLWPTLVLNLLVPWMMFVGAILAWGKGGLFNRPSRSQTHVERERIRFHCPACSRSDPAKPFKSKLALEPMTPATNANPPPLNNSASSDDDRYHVSMPEDEFRSSASSGNSSTSSATSTPFNRSPRVKSRSKYYKSITVAPYP